MNANTFQLKGQLTHRLLIIIYYIISILYLAAYYTVNSNYIDMFIANKFGQVNEIIQIINSNYVKKTRTVMIDKLKVNS